MKQLLTGLTVLLLAGVSFGSQKKIEWTAKNKAYMIEQLMNRSGSYGKFMSVLRNMNKKTAGEVRNIEKMLTHMGIKSTDQLPKAHLKGNKVYFDGAGSMTFSKAHSVMINGQRVDLTKYADVNFLKICKRVNCKDSGVKTSWLMELFLPQAHANFRTPLAFALAGGALSVALQDPNEDINYRQAATFAVIGGLLGWAISQTKQDSVALSNGEVICSNENDASHNDLLAQGIIGAFGDRLPAASSECTASERDVAQTIDRETNNEGRGGPPTGFSGVGT